MEHYIRAVTKNYANFTGRVSREEFWTFMFFNFLVAIMVFLVGFIVSETWVNELTRPFVFQLVLIYILATLVPMIAISARRIQDTGYSGTFILVNIIPYVGAIIFLIWCCIDGTSGPNMYGPDPKGRQGIFPGPQE